MSPQDLPFHVLAFLQQRITGVDELDALFLVRGDTKEAWTANTVAVCLGRTESWSRPALERLCEAELLVGRGPEPERRYAYRPATPALEDTVTALARIYEAQRTDVLRVLNDDAVERIRAAAARTFTEAIGVQKQRRKKSVTERSARKKSGADERGEGEGEGGTLREAVKAGGWGGCQGHWASPLGSHPLHSPSRSSAASARAMRPAHVAMA